MRTVKTDSVYILNASVCNSASTSGELSLVKCYLKSVKENG